MNTAQTHTTPAKTLAVKSMLAAIAIALIMQVFMALRFEVSQDEFYSLNMAYEFLRGEVSNPFQTILFRLSGVLRYVPGNEIDQIIAGRLIVFALAALTCLLIYKTSRRFYSTQASLFAVLAFFAFNYVFRHMTAYRADMIVTTLLMGIVWLVSDPKQNWKKVVVTGFLIGLSFTFALKSIFYMPIVAAFLIGRWATSRWSKQAFFHGIVMFVVAVSTYVLLYIWHDTSMFGADNGSDYLKKISSNGLVKTRLFNRGNFLVLSLINNILGWGLLFLGFFIIFKDLFKKGGGSKIQTICLLSLAVPVSTIIYYYHANPYFYPFMLAPAVIFIAAAADRILVEKHPPLFAAFILYFCLLSGKVFVGSLSQHQNTQRDVINAVHEIFPASVPVLDYCGMISSYDRLNESGLFINPDIFAMSKYSRAGQPIMREVLQTYKPQLVLANVNGLDLANEYEHPFDYKLLDVDTAVMQNNYVKFWGPVYVPGKTLRDGQSFEILVDGTYTYYGPDNVMIDDRALQNGQALNFSSGRHSVSGLVSGDAKIIWGDNLKKPGIPEPARPLFNGF